MKTLPLDMTRCVGRRIPNSPRHDIDYCPDRGRCLRFLTIERERDTLPEYRNVAIHSMLRGPGRDTCGDLVVDGESE